MPGIVSSESRTGAVADRSGAVHASGCRHCGPETVPRFQPPLINPCMHFSRTRLSEAFHRVALGAAVYPVPSRLLTQEPRQPLADVVVDLVELARGVDDSKVGTPLAQRQVDFVHD